jgi:hypothetical protein
MEYTEEEVLDIIKSCTDKKPKKILKKWNKNKSNTPIDLEDFHYPYFIYTFPFILGGEEIGKITIVYDGFSSSKGRQDLMQKYFGSEEYEYTWSSFSHDTYHWCFFTIFKEFRLPEIVPGFRGESFKSVDNDGNEIDFRVSYGHPEEGEDRWLDIYSQYTNNYDGYDFYWFDNGVYIQIKGLEDGWSLGEKINENIKKRV